MLYSDSFIEYRPPTEEAQRKAKLVQDRQNMWFFGLLEPTYNDYAQLDDNDMVPEYRYRVGDYGK